MVFYFHLCQNDRHRLIKTFNTALNTHLSICNLGQMKPYIHIEGILIGKFDFIKYERLNVFMFSTQSGIIQLPRGIMTISLRKGENHCYCDPSRHPIIFTPHRPQTAVIHIITIHATGGSFVSQKLHCYTISKHGV